METEEEDCIMLHVTSQARSELHGLLDQALARQAPENVPEPLQDSLAFRIVAERGPAAGSQLGLALDLPREGDEVVEHDGREVLLIDAQTSELLEGLTLDAVDTPEQGRRLAIRA